MTIQQVVDGGFCIGCGACTVPAPRIRIVFNRYGDLVAQLPLDVSSAELSAASAVCPFAAGADETAIAKLSFAEEPVQWDEEVGAHIACYAGYAPAQRTRGSSGGIATWLLTRMMERGLIDYALHVAPSATTNAERFFAYRSSKNADEIQTGSTSFYYPVSMDDVLQIVKSQPGRYAITGVPCFHKALRKLRAVDPVIDERICYQIGIVCGQMKSAHYLDYLLRMADAPAGELTNACFRRKVANRPANDYAFEATVRSPAGPQTVRVMNSAIGVNWGMGYFKPEACEVCDDVLAETADVAAMDAWLPKYVQDSGGWSLVVARTRVIEQELALAQSSGDLVLEPISAHDVAESQRGGLNHRRKSLPYRLWMRRGRWVPAKRFVAGRELGWPLRLEQLLRERLRLRSRSLWLRTGGAGHFAAFSQGMRFHELAYRWVQRIKRWTQR